MRRYFAVGVSLLLVVYACGDIDQSTPSEPITPQFALQGGGSATMSGATNITTAGNYTYSVCLSGRPTGNYFAELYTSASGKIDTFNLLNGSCTTGSSSTLYIDHQTADFTIWARVSKYPLNNPTYLGNTDTLSVDVNVTPPPPSASISGPEEVSPSESCQWQADVSGGTPPYTYSWWGALSGSSQTISGTVSSSSYLYLAATDSESQADTAQIFIDVDEAYECES